MKKKKRVVHKKAYWDSAAITPLESYIEDVIEDSVCYGSGCIEEANQKLETTSNILIRLIKTIIDKNKLTEGELYYIIHGREFGFLDEDEEFSLIEE